MAMRSAILCAALLGSLGLAACSGRYVNYAIAAPPAPYVAGPVGYAPGPGYVWMDGFWNLNGGRWAWVNGRWAVPPRRHAVWVADRWERHGGNWRHRRGHWR